jgi:hypothetical protein
MLRLIKNEFVKLKTPVLITLVLVTLTTVILSCTLYVNYSLHYDLEAWEVGIAVPTFVFPLFVVIPICWSLYYERKGGFLKYTMPRVSKARYLTAKWIASAICAFVLIFVPFFLAAVFALYVKPPADTEHSQYYNAFFHNFYDLFVYRPLLYTFLSSLWKGVLSVLVMSLGFVLSMYVKNIFVVLTAPFIYYQLENFVLSILNVPHYRLCTSFEPSLIPLYLPSWKIHIPEYQMEREGFIPRVIELTDSYLVLLAGPGIIIAFTVLLWLFFTKIKKVSVYEV